MTASPITRGLLDVYLSRYPKFTITYRVPKAYYADYRLVHPTSVGGLGKIGSWSNYENTYDIW